MPATKPSSPPSTTLSLVSTVSSSTPTTTSSTRTRSHLLAVHNDLASQLTFTLARASPDGVEDLTTALMHLEHALTDATGANLTDANPNGVP
jgi:hypothetical protein